ncbi:hypothetical protein DVK85_06165 [Flavobacterium arcticum]|uniref:Uncharacterized protein n=1 Tax=Flavobacterium arcticum TaxID=1784713 RepID=A0A345HB84_9FLAO|nr:hypothetical protein [Flavobacterium arcticum]AXG73844.1 hypothetical protein DVK85_06165 [Flavobacterium arcticum]KAF2511797.1 hypothetical protein E0W72_05685 [Flavobacterium arcticum]
MAQILLLDRFDILINKALELPVLQKTVEWNDNYRILLLIVILSTGLPISEINKLRWEDILDVGGIDGVKAKEQLFVRRYANYIHPIIQVKIETLYVQGFLSPKMTSLLFPAHKTENALFYLHAFLSIEQKHFSIYCQEGHPMDITLFNYFFQATFGRQVVRVCGFNKETSRQLRRHFRVKSNDEVLYLLCMDKPTVFNLENLNLYGQEYLYLESRNFENGYAFQSFIYLNKFLEDIIFECQRDAAMQCLMLLSLHNGIKMSALLKIESSDVYFKKDSLNPEAIMFCNHKLVLSKTIESAFKRYFFKYGYDNSLPLFRTNRGNRISPSSLQRELTSVMKQFGHKYYKSFNQDSFLISWGRRVISITGDHKPTIKALKERLKLKTEQDLYRFLQLQNPKKGYSIKGRYEKDIYRAITYSFPTERQDMN